MYKLKQTFCVKLICFRKNFWWFCASVSPHGIPARTLHSRYGAQNVPCPWPHVNATQVIPPYLFIPPKTAVCLSVTKCVIPEALSQLKQFILFWFQKKNSRDTKRSIIYKYYISWLFHLISSVEHPILVQTVVFWWCRKLSSTSAVIVFWGCSKKYGNPVPSSVGYTSLGCLRLRWGKCFCGIGTGTYSWALRAYWICLCHLRPVLVPGN